MTHICTLCSMIFFSFHLRDDGKSIYFCLLNLILDSKYDVIHVVNEYYMSPILIIFYV